MRDQTTPDTIDITPSPRQYRLMLKAIITCSTIPNDVQWATQELARVRDVQEWQETHDQP